VLRKSLLICGVLSSLLYLLMNIIVPLEWPAYSSASQTISELSAVGAPTRPLWVLLGFAYTLLVIAFGCGVWTAAPRNRSLRIVGALMIVYGLTGLIWPFAPMHLRGAEFTPSDAMHIVLGGVTVLLMLLATGFGAAAFGKRFCIYSVATLVTVVVFGVWTGLDAPRIAANLPTPWIGISERISLGVYLLWIVVLATVLLSNPRSAVLRAELPELSH
jgi:uncharacterized protein DUF998